MDLRGVRNLGHCGYSGYSARLGQHATQLRNGSTSTTSIGNPMADEMQSNSTLSPDDRPGVKAKDTFVVWRGSHLSGVDRADLGTCLIPPLCYTIRYPQRHCCMIYHIHVKSMKPTQKR